MDIRSIYENLRKDDFSKKVINEGAKSVESLPVDGQAEKPSMLRALEEMNKAPKQTINESSSRKKAIAKRVLESKNTATKTISRKKVIAERVATLRKQRVNESANFDLVYNGCGITKLDGYYVVSSDANNIESKFLGKQNDKYMPVEDGKETEFATVDEAKQAIVQYKKGSVNESVDEDKFKNNKNVRPRLLEDADTDETDFSIEEAELLDNNLVITLQNADGEEFTLTLTDVNLDDAQSQVYVAQVEDPETDEEDPEVDETDVTESSNINEDSNFYTNLTDDIAYVNEDEDMVVVVPSSLSKEQVQEALLAYGGEVDAGDPESVVKKLKRMELSEIKQEALKESSNRDRFFRSSRRLNENSEGAIKVFNTIAEAQKYLYALSDIFPSASVALKDKKLNSYIENGKNTKYEADYLAYNLGKVSITDEMPSDIVIILLDNLETDYSLEQYSNESFSALVDDLVKGENTVGALSITFSRNGDIVALQHQKVFTAELCKELLVDSVDIEDLNDLVMLVELK